MNVLNVCVFFVGVCSCSFRSRGSFARHGAVLACWSSSRQANNCFCWAQEDGSSVVCAAAGGGPCMRRAARRNEPDRKNRRNDTIQRGQDKVQRYIY